jgi:hypothetical protein
MDMQETHWHFEYCRLLTTSLSLCVYRRGCHLVVNMKQSIEKVNCGCWTKLVHVYDRENQKKETKKRNDEHTRMFVCSLEVVAFREYSQLEMNRRETRELWFSWQIFLYSAGLSLSLSLSLSVCLIGLMICVYRLQSQFLFFLLSIITWESSSIKKRAERNRSITDDIILIIDCYHSSSCSLTLGLFTEIFFRLFQLNVVWIWPIDE